MRTGFVVVKHPGNELSIRADNDERFVEVRSLYPNHQTVRFMQHANGMIDAILKPLKSSVQINKKYLQGAAR